MKTLLALAVLAALLVATSGAKVDLYSGSSCPGTPQEQTMTSGSCVATPFTGSKWIYAKVDCKTGDSWTYTESNNTDCSGGDTTSNLTKDCYSTTAGADAGSRSIRVDCSGYASPQAMISWVAMIALAFVAQRVTQA